MIKLAARLIYLINASLVFYIKNKMMKINMFLQGGLGNQLFQYAFSNYLKKYNINISEYYEDFKHDEYNRQFLINEVLEIPIKIEFGKQFSGIRIRSENEVEIINLINRHNLSNDQVCLEGFYQKNSFLKPELISNIKNIYPPSDILAIHVRRANYAHHGLLPISYYHKILAFLDYPEFLVYTDEVNFCKFTFSKFKGFLGVVKPELDNPSQDFLKLISHKNIIISNSSFSYMAAFLSYTRYQGKIFYPSSWGFFTEHPGASKNWICCNTKLIDYYT